MDQSTLKEVAGGIIQLLLLPAAAAATVATFRYLVDDWLAAVAPREDQPANVHQLRQSRTKFRIEVSLFLIILLVLLFAAAVGVDAKSLFQ